MLLKVAILAGGRGKRIGVDKGFLEVKGKRFAGIMIEKFGDGELVFVCRDDEQAEKYEKEFGCRVITDVVKDYGPLAGILSALEFFRDYTLVLAVDLPLVKRSLAEFIYKKARGYDALIPTWGNGKREPLLACYSPNAIPEIWECIKNGIKKVVVPFENLKTLFYPIDLLRKYDEKLISFVNVNTPSDLEMVRCLSIGLEDP